MTYEDALETVAWACVDAGVLRVSGDDAAEYLDRSVTNDLDTETGAVTHALLLDPDGKTEDSLRILARDDGFLVVSRRPGDTAEGWRDGVFIEDVTVETTDSTVVTVQGPDADEVVDALDAPSYPVRRTPAGGYDVLLPDGPDDVPGTDFGEHAEALRVEAGVPSFEKELRGRVPVGAGLDVFSDEKCYVGQEVVARVLQRGGGPSRTLRGYEVHEDVAEGDTLLDDGTAVGEITSVADSPRFGRIALGFADDADEPAVRDRRVEERGLPFDAHGGT